MIHFAGLENPKKLISCEKLCDTAYFTFDFGCLIKADQSTINGAKVHHELDKKYSGQPWLNVNPLGMRRSDMKHLAIIPSKSLYVLVDSNAKSDDPA